MEQRAYSENTAQAMDEEAKKLVDEAYKRTLLLLNEKKLQIENIAELLLKVRVVCDPSLPPSLLHTFPVDGNALPSLPPTSCYPALPPSLLDTLSLIRGISLFLPSLPPSLPPLPFEQKETINHDDIVGAIGPRPFAAHKEYAEFIESIKPMVRYVLFRHPSLPSSLPSLPFSGI